MDSPSSSQATSTADDVLAGFASRITAARESGGALDIVGGGTKAFYGRAPTGEPLATGAYRGIVEYEPAELVVSVRAGTPLETLSAVLANEGQMLGFEPPSFGAGATIGGVVAAGLSGPRRPYAGAVRDSLLGVELMSGGGEVLRFGGQVMKNVAGYDVSRLLAGSMGTLGLILTVSLKVLPRPERERTSVWQVRENEAARLMIEFARKPWPVSAMAYADRTLHVRLSGNADAVAEAERELSPDGPGDDAFWSDLNAQRLPFFHSDDPLWRLSVPPAAARIDLAGSWMCDWGGGLRWLISSEAMGTIRDRARAAGGHATLFRGEREMPFTPLDAVNAKIHCRLKDTFDPARVFNPGRMYPDL